VTATVLFEVDKGSFTSVTRIERAVWVAEAFCALRARKPVLLFVDDRYLNVFSLEGPVQVEAYDHRTIPAGSAHPKYRQYPILTTNEVTISGVCSASVTAIFNTMESVFQPTITFADSCTYRCALLTP
jgi:hypothetical protein